MKKYLILLLSLILITGCTNETKEAEIYTTIYPITFITDYLIGEHVVVSSILNENVDIHDFELKPSDLSNISNSKLFIDLGYNIIFDTNSIKNSLNGNTTFLSLDEHLDTSIVNTSNGYDNVHIWLDPINMITMSSVIKEELLKIYPDYTNDINQKYEELVDELMLMDIKYYESLSEVSIKSFITSHDAFAHLDKYFINPVSIYDESHSSEPTQKEINKIIDLINENNIKYVVVENENELSNVKVILNETKAKTVTLYDLSITPKNNKDYIDIMNENLNILIKILN